MGLFTKPSPRLFRLTKDNCMNRINEVMKLRCPREVTASGVRKPWQFITHRNSEQYLSLLYRVPAGYSYLDLYQEIDALSAALGNPVEIQNRGGGVVITIPKQDFPDEIPYHEGLLQAIPSKRHVLIGIDRNGKPIYHDFRVPHLMIAGMSGYGKTDLIRWIVYQLIARHTPEQLSIDIIDMKGFSYLPFRNIPHIGRIGRDLPSALSILRDAKTIMDRRSIDVWNTQDRSLTNTYQWKIVLIDEAAQISPNVVTGKEMKMLANECSSLSGTITCVGREARVGLIYCTQRPDATVINPQVKANMEAAIAFRTKTQSNSEIIIDRPGAERLPLPGRAIYAATEDIILQVPYIGNDDAWTQLLDPHRKEVETNENDNGEINTTPNETTPNTGGYSDSID